jgi:hypothetical protein
MTHPLSDEEKQAVFDLMRDRLAHLFGPGGSFRVTLGRASADEGLFVSTVADTIAWEVAGAFERHPVASQHRDAVIDIPENEQLWAHIESELLRLRTDGASADVRRLSTAA